MKEEKKWRDRAKEYRLFAARTKDVGARKSYEALAENCDRIARHKHNLAQAKVNEKVDP